MMPCDADEPRKPLFPGMDKGLDRAGTAEYLPDVIIGPDIMDLPQVKMISLHIPEGLLKMLKGPFPVTGVRLARQKYGPSSLLQGQPVVCLASGIGTGRLKVIDTHVNSLVYDLIGLLFMPKGPQNTLAPEPEDRYVRAGLPQPSHWYTHRDVSTSLREVSGSRYAMSVRETGIVQPDDAPPLKHTKTFFNAAAPLSLFLFHSITGKAGSYDLHHISIYTGPI